MTDEQKKLLADFEGRVRHLMFLYQTLKNENARLREELQEKEAGLQAASEEIQKQITKYENLKIARIISVRQDEVKGAKQRIAKLVREVDKCIALLNE